MRQAFTRVLLDVNFFDFFLSTDCILQMLMTARFLILARMVGNVWILSMTTRVTALEQDLVVIYVKKVRRPKK